MENKPTSPQQTEQIKETYRPEKQLLQREDLGLMEYPTVIYEHSLYSPEQQALKDTLLEELDEILERKHSHDEFESVMQKIDNVPSTKLSVELDVLDGANMFAGRSGEDFDQQVRVRLFTIFQGEGGDEELERLVKLKQENPQTRIKMVVAHGGTLARWNLEEPTVAENKWMYWGTNNQPRPVGDLVTTLSRETDVLILVCCNESELTITHSPVTLYYNKGVLSLLTETDKHLLQKVIGDPNVGYRESY